VKIKKERKMSYTPFGEFVRILRIRNHEVMGDLAKVLGVTTPFISAVENGKRNVPADWLEKISTHYRLNASEKKELENVIDESQTQYKIQTENASHMQRKVAMQFARSFGDLDDETAREILEILTNNNEKVDC
jgi:HTH-type transcriptional regulator, competence development regulator